MSGLYFCLSNWKHYQMALELLKLMIRSDVPLSADAVKLFVDNMTNDALVVRKVQPSLFFCLSLLCVGNKLKLFAQIAVSAVSGILKAQKRPHVKHRFNPLPHTAERLPLRYKDMRPGSSLFKLAKQ